MILFSIGWLLPAWLGISTLLTFVEAEVRPLLRGEDPSNSFPFVPFSARCFAVSMAWLAAAIAWWAWRLIPGVRKKREPKSMARKTGSPLPAP